MEVLLQGLPPGDERGTKPAITILRQLGDLAAESNLRISVYHHINSWADSFIHALRIVKEVNHPNVGVNFNLCPLADGRRRQGLPGPPARRREKIFVVTINGAKVGSKEVHELIQPLDRGDFDNRQAVGDAPGDWLPRTDRAAVLRHSRRRPRAPPTLNERLEDLASGMGT